MKKLNQQILAMENYKNYLQSLYCGARKRKKKGIASVLDSIIQDYDQQIQELTSISNLEAIYTEPVMN